MQFVEHCQRFPHYETFSGKERLVLGAGEDLMLVFEDLSVRRASAPDPQYKCPNCRQLIQLKPIPSIGLSKMCCRILGEAAVESDTDIEEEGWMQFFRTSSGIQIVLGNLIFVPHFVDA